LRRANSTPDKARAPRAGSRSAAIVGAALWIGVAAPTLGGCAPPTQAKLPPPSPEAAEARQAIYDNFQLTEVANTNPLRWKRADGSYTGAELSNVFEAYPKTAELKKSAESRGTYFGLLWGMGGGLVGSTLLMNYAVPALTNLDEIEARHARWSDEAIGVALAAGGGLMLISVIYLVATGDPAATITATYNEELRGDLMRTGPAPAAPPPSNTLKPAGSRGPRRTQNHRRH
jgi:hypothetical protein